MKKNRLRWLILLLVPIVFTVGACKKDATVGQILEIEETPRPLALPILRLTMSTGLPSGTYYPFGSAIAQVVDDASSYLVIDVKTSQNSHENILRIASGEAQLAIAQNDVINYAYHGTDAWSDMPSVTTMEPLMTLYPEICQFVVGANSGLESVLDLKDRRVAIGEPGTPLNVGVLRILAEYGITADDIEALPLGFDDAAQAMREKSIDAFFVTMGTPNKVMMDLQADRDITIMNLDSNIIDALIKKYPFYTRYTLNENDYSFLTEPIETVAVRATLVASSSLSDQVVYDIVKTIMENSDKIAVLHAKGMYIGPEEAVSGLPLEMHSGARRYFEEIKALEEPPQEETEEAGSP